MTSNINYTGIDAAFPIAGQDNDSQGFRDNFSIIKTALSTASNEISDIQLNYAKLNTANDFGGNGVTGATLYGNTYAAVEHNVNAGTVDAGNIFTLNYQAGEYHIVNLSTSTNFQFSNWPTTTSNDKLGKMRIEIKPDTSTQKVFNINFSSATAGANIRRQIYLPFTSTTVLYAWTQLWDVWTHDQGQNTFVHFVGTWT